MATANAFITLLKKLPNVHYITTYYKWHLIDTDADDNKYCDCAIAGGADYVITEDNHFNVLKIIQFPRLSVLGIDDFTAMFPPVR